MTSHELGMPGEYVFRRQPDGAMRVCVRLQGTERDLELGDRRAAPRTYSASAAVNAANLSLAMDLLLDLTSSSPLAAQIGERLARKLAVTFAARVSIDGLVIAREAVWRWLRWALTHPAAPVAERPLRVDYRSVTPPAGLGSESESSWTERRARPPNPLRWQRLALTSNDFAPEWAHGRSGREN